MSEERERESWNEGASFVCWWPAAWKKRGIWNLPGLEHEMFATFGIEKVLDDFPMLQ